MWHHIGHQIWDPMWEKMEEQTNWKIDKNPINKKNQLNEQTSHSFLAHIKDLFRQM